MNTKSFESKNYLFALIVSCFMSISFCVFEPVKSYITNHEEYWFSLNRAIVLYILCAAVIIIGCMLMYVVISLINSTLANAIVLLVFFIATGLYIQGNYIPNLNGVLDGSPIDWVKVNSEMILSDVLWALLLILYVLFLTIRKAKAIAIKFASVVSCSILILQVVVCITLGIMIPDFNDNYDFSITDIDEYNVSENENFVIFILDAFDASYLEDATNDERACEVLEDFTFYSDTMSLYGHTDLAIPQILTDESYKNEQSYKDYLVDAYNNSPLLNRLIDDDWNIGIYMDGHLPVCDTLSHVVNLRELDCDFSSKRHFLSSTYKLVAYTVAPYRLKENFWFYPDFVDMMDSPSDDFNLYNWENGEFYSGEDKISVVIDDPVFRLYHMRGMHLPMHTTADAVDQYDHVSMEETREANYKIIEKFTNALKEQGVYDNSTIIIMGDHGESSDDTGEWKQNPILLIKGINEHHSFVESDASITYDDLLGIFENLLDGKTEEDVLDGIDVSKERYFYRYFYAYENLWSDSFPDITEYVSKEHASKIDAMIPTGNVYLEK